MTDPPRFVVDTCVVLAVIGNEDAAHPPGEVDAARALIAMAERGELVLQRAAAFDGDWLRHKNPAELATRLDWLAASPITDVAPSAARLDVFQLDDPRAVLAEDEYAELDRHLLDVLGDDGNAKGEAKRSSDRDHLIAAVRTGADGFVTVDYTTILKHRAKLAALGVTVLWPSEAARIVTR